MHALRTAAVQRIPVREQRANVADIVAGHVQRCGQLVVDAPPAGDQLRLGLDHALEVMEERLGRDEFHDGRVPGELLLPVLELVVGSNVGRILSQLLALCEDLLHLAQPTCEVHLDEVDTVGQAGRFDDLVGD